VVFLLAYLLMAFVACLGAADWKDCFDALGRRPHHLAVTAFPWGSYRTELLLAVLAAMPGIVAIIRFRSCWAVVLSLALVSPLLVAVLGDVALMLGEWWRGEVVTAQGGWHHCDRNGTDSSGIAMIWLYLDGLVTAIGLLAVLAGQRLLSLARR
jgi:hypothetical protein